MLDALLTVLAGLALVAIVLVAVGVVRVVVLRRRFRRRIAAFSPELAVQALLFGVASDGRTQVRGVGTLLVSADRLAFLPLVGGRDVVVERDSITSTAVSRTFMGQGSAADLLVVTWDLHGLGDAAAFQVADAPGWRERLAQPL